MAWPCNLSSHVINFENEKWILLKRVLQKQIIQLKTGQRIWIDIFSKKTNGQQVHEKMLSITNYQGCANQNHNEISPHIRIAVIKKTRNNRCCQGYVEKGTLMHCWWECKLVQPLWWTVQRFFKKLKIELHMIQQS